MMTAARRLVFLTLFLVALATVPAVAAGSTTHTVDYVIGMLEAGVDQTTIIARIHQRQMVFTISEGDLDRLRSAGAGDDLVNAVTGEGRPASPAAPKATTAPGSPGGDVTRSRPRRLDEGAESEGGQEPTPSDEGEEAGRPAGADDDEEADQESPHGGYPYYRPEEEEGYHGYYAYPYAYYGAPYYYDYYPFSFYYSFGYPSYYFYPYPYYYPYRSFYYYGGPIGHRPPPGALAPRGTPRGSSGGSMGRPSAPRGAPGRPRPRGH